MSSTMTTVASLTPTLVMNTDCEVPSTSSSTSSRVQLQLAVTSDTICPFCYLGYRKLEKAIEMAKVEQVPVDIQLQFKPYILDPSLPMEGGKCKSDIFRKKFGDQADTVLERVASMGLPYDIKFNSKEGNVGNTMNSHRLIEYAYKTGGERQQRQVIEYLFNGYFERAQDIASLDFLCNAAVVSGTFPDYATAQAWFESDDEVKRVEEQCREARDRGITGVPFTVINGKYAISGAQEPESFLQVFKQIAAKCTPIQQTQTTTTLTCDA